MDYMSSFQYEENDILKLTTDVYAYHREKLLRLEKIKQEQENHKGKRKELVEMIDLALENHDFPMHMISKFKALYEEILADKVRLALKIVWEDKKHTIKYGKINFGGDN